MVLKATVQKESPIYSLPKVASEAVVCSQMLFKMGVLGNLAIFTGKQMRRSCFAGLTATLFKRDFNTGLFL